MIFSLEWEIIIVMTSIVLCKNIFFDYKFDAFYLKFEYYFIQILSYYVEINCTDIKFDSGFNDMKKYKN